MREFYAPRIEVFISRIRTAHSQMGNIFTRGGCFDFHLILQEVWPEAIPFYDTKNRHVVTEIGGNLYDIHGDVSAKCARGDLTRLPLPPWDWGDFAHAEFPLKYATRKKRS